MPKSRRPYPLEFRQRMIEMVREGRTPASLARTFEPSAQCISTWVKQADRDKRPSTDRLTADERMELQRLRPKTSRFVKSERS